MCVCVCVCVMWCRLVYWVLVGMIGLLETLIHIILYWIPFYYPLKAVFLVWAMHPQYEGATVIYTKFLKNHVKQNIEKVDRAMEKVTLENVAKVVADASANKID
jgi:receptor expression-enhancing protein 5/6